MIEITLKLPMLFIILFIFIPLIAYFDILLKGTQRTYWHYFWATFFEVLLVYGGYLLGVYL